MRAAHTKANNTKAAMAIATIATIWPPKRHDAGRVSNKVLPRPPFHNRTPDLLPIWQRSLLLPVPKGFLQPRVGGTRQVAVFPPVGGLPCAGGPAKFPPAFSVTPRWAATAQAREERNGENQGEDPGCRTRRG